MRQLGRGGFDVARCTVARLMKGVGIQGVIRGKPHRTTIPDNKAPCPLDKVNRQFRVPAPNTPWVSDFTYVAFVIDVYARKIVGSVGDRYDNALVETINGLFKAEVIHRRGPWRSFEAVEYATLERADWFNNRRLLEPIGNIPPAEAEANFYATLETEPMAA